MIYKVFISSRNNDQLFINNTLGISLTDIRLFLKNELEKEQLFGKDFLEIVINETFNSDTSNDSYNECLKQIESSNYTIALFNGNSGWAPPSIDKGICHAELAKALETSQKQVAILNVSDYFQYKTEDSIQKQRDDLFKTYLDTLNKFNNPLKIPKDELNESNFKLYLLQRIKDLILKSIENRINIASHYFKLNGSSQKQLEWKGMRFEARNNEIVSLLTKMVKQDYPDIITLISSIPHNMSTHEAKSYIGRSFLDDQDIIENKKNKKFKKGPIHFIGVYGNATETQIADLIGNPDINTVKEDFGIYVWEQTLNVQMIFLSKCITPEATTTNYNLFQIWAKATEQIELIKKRAEARYLILSVFNKAKTILI